MADNIEPLIFEPGLPEETPAQPHLYDNYPAPLKSIAQFSRGIADAPAGGLDVLSLITRLSQNLPLQVTADGRQPDMSRLIDWLDNTSANYKQRVSDAMGVPQGGQWYETMPEAVGQAVFPIPGGLEAQAAKTGSKALRTAGEIADAVLVPGTINPSAKTLAMNAGVAATMDQGINKYANPDYQTVLDAGINALAPGAQAADTESPFPTSTSTSTGVEPLDFEPGLNVDEQTWWQRNRDWIVGGTVAAGVGAYLMKRYAKVSAPPKVGMGVPSVEPGVTPLATKAKQAVFDAETPTWDLANPQDRQFIRENLLQRTRQGADTSAAEYIKTGAAPGASPVQAPSLAKVKTVFDAMEPQKQDLLNQYMTAQTLKDSRIAARNVPGARRGVTPDRVINPATGQRYTDQELDTIIMAGRADPDVAAVANQLRLVSNGLVEHAVQRGVLSRMSALQITRNNPNYAPLMDVNNAAGTTRWERLKQFFGSTSVGDQAEKTAQFMARTRQEASGVTAPLNTMDAHMINTQATMAWIEKTSAINDVLRRLQGARRVTISGRPLVERVSPNREHNFSTMERGKTVYYNIRDQNLLQALNVEPYHVVGVTNGLRKLWTSGVTGKLRPYFAIGKSWLYDAPAAATMRPQGHALGYLDYNAQRFLGQKAGDVVSTLGMIDPTVYLSALSGVAKHIDANASFSMSMAMNRAIQKNGRLVQMLGPQNVQLVADWLEQSYKESFLHQVNRYGGVDASLHRDTVNGVQSLAKTWEGHPIGTFYNNVLEGFHTGGRLQQAWLSYKLGRPINTAVAEGRQAAGDLTRKGGSKMVGRITSAVPFSNVALQEISRIGRFAAEHPVRFASSLAFGMMVPKAMEAMYWSHLSDAHRQFYYEQMPEYVRSAGFVLPVPGAPPEDYLMLPMHPGMMLVANSAADLVSLMLDLRGTSMDNPLQISIKDFLGIGDMPTHDPIIESNPWIASEQALKNFAVAPIPPVFQVPFAAATGQRLEFDAPGEMGRPPMMDRTPGLFGGGRTKDDVASATLQEILSSAFGTVMDSLFETARETKFGFQRDGITGAAENVGEDFLLNTKKAFPYLFPGALKNSTYTEQKRMLRSKMDGVKTLLDQFSGEFSQGTFRTKSAGKPFPSGDTRSISGDPRILNAMAVSQFALRTLNARNDEINTIRESINRTRGSATLRPMERAKELRELTRQEQDATELLLSQVRSVEENIRSAVPDLGEFKFEDWSTGAPR